MLITIILSLLTALILSWFGFYNLLSNAIFDLFKFDMSVDVYYFVFIGIGMLRDLKIFRSNSTVERSNEIDN